MAEFPTKLNTNNMLIKVGMTVGSGSRLPYYEGSYEVTPQIVPQVLPTKNKSMSKDVLVHEIPYTETSNLYGGYTVNIAYPN